MFNGHLNNLGNAVLVNLVHGEGLDAVLLQELLLASVNITETNVDNTVGGEAGLDPGELLDLASNSKQEGDGASVDVATLGGLGSVDVLIESTGWKLVRSLVRLWGWRGEVEKGMY